MKPSPSYYLFNSGQSGVLMRHLGPIIATNDIPEGNITFFGEVAQNWVNGPD